jgi:hypothetical protein
MLITALKLTANSIGISCTLVALTKSDFLTPSQSYEPKYGVRNRVRKIDRIVSWSKENENLVVT